MPIKITGDMIPIRRVVTGVNEKGRSIVAMDGPAPAVSTPKMGSGRRYTDLWIWNAAPLSLSDQTDGSTLGYVFPGPAEGGHIRVVQANSPTPDFVAKNDAEAIPLHEPKPTPSGRMWDRGGNNGYTSAMHKTQTVDYGILLAGERILVLDGVELPMRPGDIVIQVGAFHAWASPNQAGLMAFDMIGAEFIDGPVGLGQGNDKPVEPKLPEGVKPVRRIVTIDREPGISSLVSDGPAPDVRLDPARPGFAATRLWVTDKTPARIVFETVHLPNTLEPPKNGSVLRVYDIPPDAAWQGRVGEKEVRAWFQSMGSPSASVWSENAPHPYMQKTKTVDFCFVLEGEATLVLEDGEVTLGEGDTVVQRGTAHAWANRSGKPARVAVASHDAV